MADEETVINIVTIEPYDLLHFTCLGYEINMISDSNFQVTIPANLFTF